MNTHTVVRLPSNVETYYSRMGSSMRDKLFFLERIPQDVTVFADFGCGDGELLSYVGFERKGPNTILLGYDRSADALELARHKNPDGLWTPSYEYFKARLDSYHRVGRKSCLILSSVVHEVLTQIGPTGWFRFWSMIRSLGCTYIAIRDMAVELDTMTQPVDGTIMSTLAANPLMSQVLLYGVQEPGIFASRADMLQGLLKYRYEDDLHKELDENYFPLSSEQWLNLTNIGSGYAVRHFDHYSLPFNRAKWFQDFGLNIPDATHIKLILKRI